MGRVQSRLLPCIINYLNSSSDPASFASDSPDSPDSFLHLHLVIVFVRDQERSLRFYLEQFGFSVTVDRINDAGRRWIEVMPPEGNARLALVTPQPGSQEESLIGRFTWIFFLAADVNARFHDWQSQGVKFHSPPTRPALGAMSTRFEDVDGNSFGLLA